MKKRSIFLSVFFLLGFYLLSFLYFFLGTVDLYRKHTLPFFSLLLLCLFSGSVLVFLYVKAPHMKRKTRGKRYRAVLWLLMLLPLVLYFIFYTPFLSLSELTLATVLALILSVLAEECYFRGMGFFLFCRAEQKGEGIQQVSLRAAWLLSLLFGLAHVNRLFIGEIPVFVVGEILYATSAGIFLLALYVEGESLLYPSLFHVANNLLPLLFRESRFGSDEEALLLSGVYSVAVSVYYIAMGVFLLRKRNNLSIKASCM